MTLPVRQQQALNQIEITLQLGDPRLKSMFATFTRLTSPEAMPTTEAIRARLPRPLVVRLPRPLTLLSIVLAAVLTAVLLGVLAGSSSACPRATARQPVAQAAAHAVACRVGTAAGAKKGTS
jgi:hypothetical protein